MRKIPHINRPVGIRELGDTIRRERRARKILVELYLSDRREFVTFGRNVGQTSNTHIPEVQQ